MTTLHVRNVDDNAEEWLLKAGIDSKAELEKLGADKAYKLLLTEGCPPDLHLYYRLMGAIEDLDWQVVADREQRRQEEKQADCDN